MRIAVIGGGLTGLTAAYELAKRGITVTVFEKEAFLGGLAGGFKKASWNWHLEQSYHHFFTNDTALLSLAKNLGIDDKIIIRRPETATLTPLDHTIYPLDSPLHLLKFSPLSFFDRLRTGAFLAFCKVWPWWQPLETITAKQFAITLGGLPGWKTVWEPLIVGKFGSYANDISASWLWARIYKRTTRLGYFRGGFQTLLDALEKAIKKNGGTIFRNTNVTSVQYDMKRKGESNNTTFVINHTSCFDRILITAPSSIATSLMKFPKQYINSLKSISHLNAQTLILETKEPILNKTYWLNINDRSFPFIAAVAHTNFIDIKHYGGHHITYFGNYLPAEHPYLSLSKDQLFHTFEPYIKKINPHFSRSSLLSPPQMCTIPHAQPVHTIRYSSKAPKFETPIPNVFLANLDSIFPWDRGTNYAVELGKHVTDFVLSPC